MEFGKKSYTGTTRVETLQGKLHWHNLAQLNDEGEWKLTLYPDQPSLDKINKLKEEGLLNALRKDDEGYNMTFKRVHKRKLRSGKEMTLTAPVVVDKNSKPIDGYGLGYGSDVTIKLQVYKYSKPGGSGVKGTAARLEAVRVDNLVPFEIKRDLNTQQAFAIKGLDEVPEPIF